MGLSICLARKFDQAAEREMKYSRSIEDVPGACLETKCQTLIRHFTYEKYTPLSLDLRVHFIFDLLGTKCEVIIVVPIVETGMRSLGLIPFISSCDFFPMLVADFKAIFIQDGFADDLMIAGKYHIDGFII